MQKNDLEGLTRRRSFVTIRLVLAGIAHLVERHLAKVEVASSSLVARSKSLIRKDEAFLLLKFKSSMPSGCMSCAALSHWDSGPAGKTAEERVNFHKVYGLSLYNSGKNWYNDVQYFVERREIP